MKILLRSILFAFIFICFHNNVFAQQIDSTLNVYGTVFQPEKLYIQYDKPAYSPGETIWFKAYLMQGIYPSITSKSYYIDWTDDQGNMLYHTTGPIVESSGHGQFEVPAKFAGSTIHVRAYTSWMLNFDTTFLYNKDIRIFQKSSVKSEVPAVISSLQFFPEGGDAVAAMKDKIAFKANDQFGRPVKIRGIISDSKNKVIDSFKSTHDGMGYLFLMPELGETYKAKWVDEQKATHETLLPEIKKLGATLEISLLDSGRKFTISRSSNADEPFLQMHIVATMQQQLVYMANVNLTETNTVSGIIPSSLFTTGILQLTLLDKNWQPVAERITFINNNDAIFPAEAGFSTLGLSKRKQNVLVINVPDSIQANLSVSVTDEGVGVDSSDNIIAHLLLTGDIHGAVYNPSYYFSDNKNAQKDLDLIMLTHGWRRYNWSDIVQGKYPVIKYPHDSSYVFLGGKIFGATPDQLRDAKYILALLSLKDSTKQTLTIPIDKNGLFSKRDFYFYDTIKMYYQFPSPNMSEVTEISVMNGLLPSPRHLFIDHGIGSSITLFDTTGTARSMYLAAEVARLKSLSEDITLKDVVVTTRVKTPMQLLDEKYTSGLFSGEMDDVAFDLLDDKNAVMLPSVFNYLQGRVAGLSISIDNSNNVTMQWRGSSNVDVYLNELKVDASQLSTIPMSDVAYVKVFRPPFFGSSSGGAGGAIAVYTKKGNDQPATTKHKGLPYKFVVGYSPVKEFYSPNYGTFDQKNDAFDLRSTLYWNPLILTSHEKHTFHFVFYNNDVSESFRVVLEGVSKDGRLVRIEKVIE